VQKKQAKWGILFVWGFADVPISWKGSEHGYSFGGENDYALIVLPNNKYLSFQFVGSHDRTHA